VETGNEKPAVAAPPYFAFRTLLNTLEDMKTGVPNRIDRSFLVGMSGAGQTQFITGLKSLGLIDAAGNVSERLRQMAQGSPTDRKRILSEVLKERYPEAVKLGETNATTAQLLEVFRDLGATGDTARKGIAFYLQAAKYAGDIPLSRYFQTPKISSGAGSSRKRRKASDSAKPIEEIEQDNGGGGGTPFPEFHPVLSGVLGEFPAYPAGWTKARRDEVVKMFELAVDFTIPIQSEEEIEEEERDAEEEAVELED
jgi:hypothetical protein